MNYSQQVMHQLVQSAVCNRFHSSVQRLARWLILTAERADTNRFELTHEFVAQMVGGPRSAVSESASTLRDKGIIDYRRGVLTIRMPSVSARSRASASTSCHTHPTGGHSWLVDPTEERERRTQTASDPT